MRTAKIGPDLRLRRGQVNKKFYQKWSENSTSQIVFRTNIFRKLTLGAPALPYTDESEASSKLVSDATLA